MTERLPTASEAEKEFTSHLHGQAQEGNFRVDWEVA